MLLQNKKVAVVGGGPAGLTFAKLIQQAGAHVNVYEWDVNEYARIKGGTLDIHNDLGQKALEKAGLLAEFYKRARPVGERLATIDGTILTDIFPDPHSLYNRPEIDRNDLRKLLLENLKPDTVVWNSKLVLLEKQNEKYLLHFKNGKTETADFVVGADGGKSTVRKLITATTPQYTGIMIIQGEVLQPNKTCPNFRKLCGEGNLGVIAEQKFLFSQIKARGALNYYISFRSQESRLKENEPSFSNNQQARAFLDELLVNWNEVYKELFAATDEFTLLPMRKMPLQNWQPHQNITLIGDAAHVMPPFAGIGVNIGLLDALYLAENLTDGKPADIQTAIDNYEAKMFAYAASAQEATTEAETGIHSDRDLGTLMQDRR